MTDRLKFHALSLSFSIVCFALLAQSAAAQIVECKTVRASNNNVSTSAARARVVASLNAQSRGRPIGMKINCRRMGHYMGEPRYDCHGTAQACFKTGKRPLKRYRRPGPALDTY